MYAVQSGGEQNPWGGEGKGWKKIEAFTKKEDADSTTSHNIKEPPPYLACVHTEKPVFNNI